MEREYFIDYSDPEKAARTTVEMYRDTLVSFRKTTPYPEELEWEIRVYDYILEDPLPRLEAYNKARYPDGITPIEKRAAIAKLGWDIP